jgi:hypothetical protein
MKKIKNFNDSIDDLFSNIDLPTDEEINQHTISHRTAERNKEPQFRQKVSNGLKKHFGSLEERFFNYVTKHKNECWTCSKRTIMHEGTEYQSKEISLILHNKKQTAECIITTCGNNKCVNPKHLKCVDREETALITICKRKKISRGNGHPSKLSIKDVNDIKKMYNNIFKKTGKHKGIATEIHKVYHTVTLSAICQIIKPLK